MENPTNYQDHEISRNGDHIRTLTIFHYVMAGLYSFSLIIIIIQISIIMAMPAFSSSGYPFNSWMLGVIVFCVLICITLAVGNFLSAQKMKSQCGRKFSIAVAAIQCLNAPLGTALGAFTIIVLTKESVIRHYYRENNT